MIQTSVAIHDDFGWPKMTALDCRAHPATWADWLEQPKKSNIEAIANVEIEGHKNEINELRSHRSGRCRSGRIRGYSLRRQTAKIGKIRQRIELYGKADYRKSRRCYYGSWCFVTNNLHLWLLNFEPKLTKLCLYLWFLPVVFFLPSRCFGSRH